MIPKGWTQSTVGEVFAFQRTVALSRAQLSDGAPCGYIHYGDIHTRWNTHLDLGIQELPSCALELVPSATRVADGDLVLADASEDMDGVGKAVEVRNVGERTVVAGLHTVLMRPKPQTFAPGFAGFLTSMPTFVAQARTLAAGLKVFGLSKSSLATITVLLPPLAEQRAIAEALSDADALVESLDALIAKKRDMKQAAMQRFFSKSMTPDNGNSLIRFGLDVSMKARIGWQGLTTAEYLARGAFRLVTGTDIQGGAINWDACWYVDQSRYEQDKYIQLKEDDVLVTKDGTIGKVGFVDSLPLPATLNSGVFVLRPVSDRIQARYLRHLMFSRVFGEFLDRLTAGSTITHLYQKDFETFAVVVPGVEEQSAIAQVLSDMDAEIDALVAQREKAELVKQGMMQELLSGRVRLV